MNLIMKNNPLVSIIIPIWNVENYLADCVESVLKQTYTNLEIILVDDESPDMSGEIADKLAKQDQRIKVIHKNKNEGLNMARATGFTESTGSLITFVDSDDMLTATCIEVGVEALKKYKADFVRFKSITYKDKEDLVNKLQDTPLAQEKLISNKKGIFETNIGQGLITVWGAIYARGIVAKINWHETNYRIYEDNIWTLRLLEHVDSGVYITNPGYLYRFDDTITDVLSKRTAGNSYNGKPVGYLEFIHILLDEYERLNKKFSLHADDTIRSVTDWHWNHRLHNICKAQDWQPEKNDEKYVIDLLKWSMETKERLEKQNQLQQSRIGDFENLFKKKELERASSLSIKGSIYLLAGNIARKLGVTRRRD